MGEKNGHFATLIGSFLIESIGNDVYVSIRISLFMQVLGFE